MSLTPILIGLFIVGGLFLLTSLIHAAGARRHWRERHRMRATYRSLWSLLFLIVALVAGFGGATLLGYRRLTDEALIAHLTTRELAPQRYAVDIAFADGGQRHVELAGDQWQLDAHVIKWQPRAVVLGAPPLFRVERLSGRYRNSNDERERVRSVVDLAPTTPLDLWSLKRRFPTWLPWIDTDFGSAAYLPLVDGGQFSVSLSPTGGLVARASDSATAEKISASGL
ncbi:MAG: hypothetical protein ABI451_04615 [Dokdonella sp.]